VEAWQDVRRALEQQDAGLCGIDAAEVGDERDTRHLGDGGGELDSRRARTNQYKRQRTGTSFGILGFLSLLVGAQDSPPDCLGVGERLQAGRVGCKLIVPEIGGSHAGGDDQIVERHRALRQRRGRHAQGARSEVDVGHLAQHYGEVSLPPRQLPKRCRHVGWREHRGCHLVEQRLKDVMVAAVDQQNIGVTARQGACGGDACKAAADDDDPWTRGR